MADKIDVDDVKTDGGGTLPGDSLVLEQVPCSAAQAQALQTLTSLREQIGPSTVPSGVLLEGPADADALDAFDGSESTPVATSLDWIRMWELVKRSRVGDAEGVDVDIAGLEQRAGTVPIVIADLEYERARPRWVAALAADEQRELSGLIRPGRAFLATALLAPRVDLFTLEPGRHHGLEVEFDLRGHLGNAARPASYSLDPGDGEARPFAPDQPVRHRYDEPGNKTITLRARDADGHERVARFSLEVVLPAPIPNAIWETGTGALDRAYVYYGRPGGQRRTRLEQPVLISDGFPGGRNIDELWPLVNQSRFVDSLLDAGKDVILIGYQDGKKAIGESAKQYTAVIQRAIRERVGGELLVVGGASMGGLIARYALCKLEHDNPDDPRPHQTRLFFTVDTPHYGANIATSVQAFLQLYHDHSDLTREMAALINSAAAQQMLLYWIPPRSQWRDGEPLPPTSELRHAFVRELRSIGWMPRRVDRRVAVADGLGNGQGNGVPAGAKAFWFECTMFAWANMWAAHESIDYVAHINRILDAWKIPGGAQRIDGAPGGTRKTWAQVFDGVNGFPRELWHASHCFVSTTSACGIAGSPWGPVSREASEFDEIATSTTENLEHVALPAELKNFLTKEIAGLAATGPVVELVPVFHPDCLRSGDEVCFQLPPRGEVFRREPGHNDAMIARDHTLHRDSRLRIVREGAALNFLSDGPSPRFLGRVQRDREQPFEASKPETNLWTRLAPMARADRMIRLTADNGYSLAPMRRAMGSRLEALGQSDEGVWISLVEQPLADGDVLALRADNGRFVSRMGVAWGRPIAATKQQPDMHCRFVVRLLGGDRLALRNEGTHYIKVLTRGSTTRIEADSEQLDAYGHFTLVLLGRNRVALRGFGDGYAQRVDEDQEIRPSAPRPEGRAVFELFVLARG